MLVFFTDYSECYLHNIHFNLSLCIFMDNRIRGVSRGRLKEAPCATGNWSYAPKKVMR